jgi:enterochelin esterase family protein
VPYGGAQSNNTATFERYLVEEIIPQVERKYRVARGRENRAIAGLSMGGGYALQIGLGHLDLFSAVAAFSSAVPGNFERRFQALLDNPEGTNKKLKVLWIGCGRQDAAFERNQKLSELLTAHQVRNTFHPTDGLHNFALWRRYLVEIAPLLFGK